MLLEGIGRQEPTPIAIIPSSCLSLVDHSGDTEGYRSDHSQECE